MIIGVFVSLIKFVAHLAFLPVFTVFGIIYNLAFWPLLYLLFGGALILVALWNGEKITKDKVQKFLLFGPFICLLWGLMQLLDYLGISIVGQAKKVLDSVNWLQESVRGTVKDVVKDTAQGCKNTAVSCKNTAVSYKDKVKDAAVSCKDKAVSLKDKAFGYFKSKLKKTEEPDKSEGPKEE